MPRTDKQLEELRNAKTELIESVAMKCFAAKGFHATSISYIARKAGISAGLMYNYFSGKDELLKSIYLKGIKKVFAPLEGEALTKEKFMAFIEYIFNEMETNTEFWKLYFIVISQPDVLARYQAYMLETALPIMNAIISYFAKQRMKNPEVEAQFLFSTLDGVCINYLINYPKYPLKQIKQKILKNYA
ncbi:MAG TPA: TetR/AcrR family transcriptional regulator [Bacteroidia bacterium]|nr:TetR/AcrR family transcriptional regulator [Bacteroidia bacterium]